MSAVLLALAGGLLVTSLQDATPPADPPAFAVEPMPAGEPAPVVEAAPVVQAAPVVEAAPAADPVPALGTGGTPQPGQVVSGPPAVVPLSQRSAPVELRIPAIDLRVPVTEVGLNADETVQVPTDFQLPGWYRLGTAPGQVGSAVILGHVDSVRGPAVFFRLRALRAGDAVEVTLADGTVARFAVTEVATYPKDRFPAEQVYGAHGHSALVLVTCGGEFDRAARSYRSNVVAYTTLVETVGAPPAG